MLFRRGNTHRHRVFTSDAKLIRRQYGPTLTTYDRYEWIQQRSSNATGSARTVVLLEKSAHYVSPRLKPQRGNRHVVSVKHAKGIRDGEALEGQRLADFVRAGHMAGFLIVGGLWEGGCCFGDS